MKMKDMTIGQIETAAVENAEKYITHFRLAAKNAFIEGATWAYQYLLDQGHEPRTCENGCKEDKQ